MQYMHVREQLLIICACDASWVLLYRSVGRGMQQVVDMTCGVSGSVLQSTMLDSVDRDLHGSVSSFECTIIAHIGLLTLCV